MIPAAYETDPPQSRKSRTMQMTPDERALKIWNALSQIWLDRKSTLLLLTNHIHTAISDERAPIAEVYKKYKHMDNLMSNPECISDDNFRGKIIHDLWQAIRHQCGETEKTA